MKINFKGCLHTVKIDTAQFIRFITNIGIPFTELEAWEDMSDFSDGTPVSVYEKFVNEARQQDDIDI